jgi:hypothetical protein
MEARRFDAITRLLAVPAHRRVVLGAAVIGGMLGRPATPAPVRAAAQQTAVCDASGASNFGSSGNPRYAETFTAAVGGKLSRINITVDKAVGSTGDFVVALHAVDPATGFPTDNVLARKKVANSNVPEDSFVIVQARFKKRKTTKLVKDQTYAVVISRPNANDNGAGSAVRVDTGNPCADSRFFFSPQLTGAFQEPGGGVDMLFEAFVGF